MSISAITASTATSTIQSATSRQHRTNPVQQLFNAIKSGDLTAAQTAYQQLLANAPSSSSTGSTSASSTSASSGSSSSSSSANPLQQLLDQLGTALQSGDISSAQTALSSFLANAPGGSGGNGGDQSTTGKAISSLFSAIQSGDLSTAQSDYATVSALLSGTGSTTVTGSGTSATGGTGQDSFQQLISQIGTALQSGDISSAQSALSQFQSDTPPPPPPPGNGPDSSTGKAISSLFSSIQSGDLTSAQSAYASLESLLGGSSTSSSASSTSSSGSASSASGSSTNSQDLFQQLLDNIGTDLSNNDLTSAQTALTNFSKGASSGLAYNFYA